MTPMKKDNRKPVRIPTFIVIAGLLGGVAFLSNGSAALGVSLFQTNKLATDPQNNNKPKPSRRPTQSELEIQRSKFWSRFPSVRFDESESSDPSDRESLVKKDKHFGRVNLVIWNPSDSGESTVRVNEWSVGLAALPSAASDAIVIADVERSKARLSHDKSAVYSEFASTVRGILKDTGGRLKDGCGIIVLRIGGIVHYPNGHTELYAIAEQNMPSVGGRYLFFLKTIDDGKDYEIVTGYELNNGQIIPLDGSDQFRTYSGVSQDAFLTTLSDTIRQPETN